MLTTVSESLNVYYKIVQFLTKSLLQAMCKQLNSFSIHVFIWPVLSSSQKNVNLTYANEQYQNSIATQDKQNNFTLPPLQQKLEGDRLKRG